MEAEISFPFKQFLLSGAELRVWRRKSLHMTMHTEGCQVLGGRDRGGGETRHPRHTPVRAETPPQPQLSLQVLEGPGDGHGGRGPGLSAATQRAGGWDWKGSDNRELRQPEHSGAQILARSPTNAAQDQKRPWPPQSPRGYRSSQPFCPSFLHTVDQALNRPTGGPLSSRGP